MARNEALVLGGGYSVEVDGIGKDEWSRALQEFSDANFYQTWSYGSVRWGERNLSHAVMRHNGEIVSIAQLRIARIPVVGVGVAYAPKGPLWKRTGREHDKEIFRNMVRSMQEVYVKRRNLLLRILPNALEGGTDALSDIMTREGFVPREPRAFNRTILMDLTPPAEELRKGLRRNLRQHLGYAEKLGLDVAEGNGEELFDTALALYREMHSRKAFTDFVDMDELKSMQKELPDALKLKLLVCRVDGEPAAALAWSTIGETGLPLLAATGKAGMKTYASYLLHWKMIERMKEQGCRWYDLGGINPERNPGGYTFKSGLAGKYGADVRYLCPFDRCENSFTLLLQRGAEQARDAVRKAVLTLEKRRIRNSRT